MRSKIIRNSFLVTCASFAFSNAYAMEPPEENKGLQSTPKAAISSQMPLEEKWTIQEHRDTAYYTTHYSRLIIARPISQQNASVNEISVGERTDNRFSVSLLRNNNYKGMTLSIKSELSSFESFYEKYIGMSYDVICPLSDKVTPGKFLSVFYNKDLIPDIVIDRIIKHIGIDDFRMNADSLIERINEKMTENSSAEDFKNITCAELETIKDPVRREEITWSLAQELKESKENFDRQLIIDLCDQINSKELPFFKEAKTLQANLAFSDDSIGKVDIEERYKSPLINLIATNGFLGAQDDLNTAVKGFIHNDSLSSQPLEEDLKNLDLSPESFYKLLNVIRKQNIELKLLREKK
jgi:hypothetical protein